MTAPASAKGWHRRAEGRRQRGSDSASPKTVPFLLPADETFDVGIDTRTGVNDQDYQVPFRFNGKIDNVTFNLGPTHLTATEEMKVREATARAHD